MLHEEEQSKLENLELTYHLIDDAGPVPGLFLSEQPCAWIPRAVGAIHQPPPIGKIG